MSSIGEFTMEYAVRVLFSPRGHVSDADGFITPLETHGMHAERTGGHDERLSEAFVEKVEVRSRVSLVPHVVFAISIIACPLPPFTPVSIWLASEWQMMSHHEVETNNG